MTDFTRMMDLFNKNHVSFRDTLIYNTENEWCGYAIWLDTGHLEFDVRKRLVNIVTY